MKAIEENRDFNQSNSQKTVNPLHIASDLSSEIPELARDLKEIDEQIEKGKQNIFQISEEMEALEKKMGL
ncbi:hypothetical protein F7734_50850 [Scytonema sp. UIC 10036]|uniref:hypothetical protein n=1 Tax=Scytonema sp. UIC 10036 TaxID=2304196 RepID=UPI0012DA7376|nr:hypothetical protein [Scytonema sp. UIC 10036]MUH00137.1 hypothetical protein [Scytonema sp. UIC 10036]